MRDWLYKVFFTAPEAEILIPVWAAAKFLSVSTMMILSLVADHKIMAHQDIVSNEYLQLERQSIIGFKDDYVRSFDLAKTYDRNLNLLSKALPSVGVDPIRYHFNDGTAVSFFRRQLIDSIDVRQALQGSYRTSLGEQARRKRRRREGRTGRRSRCHSLSRTCIRQALLGSTRSV